MGHPLSPNLTNLSTDALTDKYNDLMRRYNTAWASGNYEIIRQIQLILEDYNAEMEVRRQKSLQEMEERMAKRAEQIKKRSEKS
jgi:hypothetical protein